MPTESCFLPIMLHLVKIQPLPTLQLCWHWMPQSMPDNRLHSPLLHSVAGRHPRKQHPQNHPPDTLPAADCSRPRADGRNDSGGHSIHTSINIAALQLLHPLPPTRTKYLLPRGTVATEPESLRPESVATALQSHLNHGKTLPVPACRHAELVLHRNLCVRYKSSCRVRRAEKTSETSA